MTVTGVGPKWVALSALFSAPFIAARVLWPAATSLSFLPRAPVVVVGVTLTVLGLGLCTDAVVRLARGFPRGELFTRGAYGVCRHPIYGSWIVLTVPGMVLLADSWVGLLVTIPMYVALRLLVRAEEEWLERTFGDAYRAYRDRVPAVLPIGWLRRR
jgi:protein-S-isoprenylcysteine O-methyltransferase Ste14